MSGSQPLPSIGLLRKTAQVQSRTVSSSPLGEAQEVWSTVGSRRCHVGPLSGREQYQAQQVQADVTHRITMRYYAGLLARWRLIIDGVIYQVQSAVNPDGRQRFHELLCVVLEPKP